MNPHAIERYRIDETSGLATFRAFYGPYPDRASGYRAMDAMTLYPRQALRLVTVSNGNLCQAASAVGANFTAALPLEFAEETRVLLLPTVEAPV